MYKSVFKRLIDIIFSSILIIILSPILLIVGILLKIKIGSPIIFKQSRPGKDEKIFRMYKFRTMRNDKDKEGNLLADEERLTKIGAIIRSLSIDELPELINILKGDMSFVGPRPLLVSYLPLYNQEQAKRHIVRPGLTGLAQVNGRNNLSWEEKFCYDVEYVDNLNFMLDLKILVSTIGVVLKRDGINSENNELVEPFKGTKMDFEN